MQDKHGESLGEPNVSKRFDLEDRTLEFARCIRRFAKRVTMELANREDLKQLVRSSGSVGANYIEANEALSRKDFLLRIRICRKEAKESRYWLQLLDLEKTPALESQMTMLMQESHELMNIFGAILRKSDQNLKRDP
jgi:four helix bundle protein